MQVEQTFRHRWRAPQCGRRAFALPLAIIVALLVIILGLAIMELSGMEAVKAEYDVHTMKALAAAEMGLQRAKAMAASQNLPWREITYNGAPLEFFVSADAAYGGNAVCALFSAEPVAANDETATYKVVVENTSRDVYRIHAFGYAGNRVQHITENTRGLTFGAFSWFTNTENDMNFASGDVVPGWVYTNGSLNIHGRPTFTGRANSGAASLNYFHGGAPADKPDFQQGITLSSPQLDITAALSAGHVTAVREAALQNGIWLGANAGRPYKITFNVNGTVTFEKEQELTTGGKKGKTITVWTPLMDQVDLATTNGAIYVEETVQVCGVVNGQVTLATPEDKDVYILDNLVYAYPSDSSDVFDDDFDLDDPQLDDKLAIIAGHDIILQKTQNQAWPQMTVMASLMALTGSLQSHESSSYGYKNIHILGSIAQNIRGAVGNSPNRGFLKNYKYDERFLNDPPLYLPVATYSYDTWRLN